MTEEKSKSRQQLAELLAIANAHKGIVQPEDVVAFARNKNTALHAAFEWDNSKAAEQYRLYQARHLIRVMVDVVPYEGREVQVQAFVSLKSERYEEGGYRYMPEVMKTEDGRQTVIDTALWELKAFQNKYRAVRELAEVFEAIEKVIKRRKK